MRPWSTRRTLSLALAAAITLTNGVSALALEPAEEQLPAVSAPNVLATPYDIYPKPQDMMMGNDTLKLTNIINIVTEEGEISDSTLERAKRIFEGHEFVVSGSRAPDKTNLILDVYHDADTPQKHNITAQGEALLKKGESEGAIAKNQYGTYDNHVIRVDQDIVVYGIHDKAVYYGLATIEQMLEQSPDGLLMKVDINDYANAKWRGIIEGFYGIAYSKEDIINFMKWGEKFKMNTFMYGPKGDPYHLSKWKEHYPKSLTEEQLKKGMLTENDIREITTAGNKYGISFTWTIHPMMIHGIDLTSGTTDGTGWQEANWTSTPNNADLTNMQDGLNAIVDKYSYMYDLGVRQFGLFVDDIDGAMAERCSVQQRRLLEEVQLALQGETGRYNGSTDIQKFKDINQKTFYVPTKYATGWVGQNDQNLKELQNLNPKVKDNIVIMYTGDGVWSSLNNQNNITMTNHIGRKPMLWWNEPCNDDAFNYTYLGPIEQTKPPVDNRLYDLTGVMPNPMCESEASKVAVGSVLGLDWNMSAFDDKSYSHKAWETSVRSLFPKEDKALADAFFLFAKHSEPRPMDNDYTGIKKYADAMLADLSANGSLTAQSDSQRQKMAAEMDRLVKACDLLSREMPNHEWSSVRNMYNEELKPWILKAKKMAELSLDSIELLQTNESNINAYQNSQDTFYRVLKGYTDMNNSEDFVIYPQRGAGDQTYEMGRTLVSVGGGTFNTLVHTMREYAEKHYNNVLSPRIPVAKPTALSNGYASKLSLAADTATKTLTATEAITLKTGDYIGISLNALRTSQLATNMPKELTLQYSTNGKTWKTLSDANALTNEQASAVRLINMTISDVVIAAQSSFALTPSNTPRIKVSDGVSAECVISPAGHHENYTPSLAVDGRTDSFFWSNRSPGAGDTITIHLPELVDVKKINLYMGDGSKGDALSAPVTVQLSQDGNTWYDIAHLNVDGVTGQHTLVTPSVNNEEITEEHNVQNIVIPNTSSQITQARHIRLSFTGSQQTWLKIREIFVNDIADLKPSLPTSSLPLADGSSVDNMLDNRLDTYMETKDGMIAGKAFNFAYASPALTENIQLVFGGGQGVERSIDTGMLVGKARVSVSSDNGAKYVELGKLNETFMPQFINGLQTFTIDSDVMQAKNISTVTHLRVEFLEDQTAPLHVYRVALNQVNWSHVVDQDGKFISALDDSNYATGFMPTSGGWVQVALPTSNKLNTISVFADATSAPQFEILTNGSWQKVTATKRNGYEYVMNVSDLMNISDLRISYDQSNLPYAIYEVTTTSSPYVDVDKSELYKKIADLENKLATATHPNVVKALKQALEQANKEVNSETTKEALDQQIENANHALAVKPSGGNISGGGSSSGTGGSVSGPIYDDVKASAWYYDAVEFVNKFGLMIGTDKTHFSPNQAMNRGMVVTVLWRYAGKPEAGNNKFSDVASGVYYTDAVAWAASQGIITGYPNGKFGPSDKMTREQFAATLYRYAKSPAVTGNLNQFKDKNAISDFAKNAMTWAVSNGIMKGTNDGNLSPKTTATRAQVAQMLKNFILMGF